MGCYILSAVANTLPKTVDFKDPGEWGKMRNGTLTVLVVFVAEPKKDTMKEEKRQKPEMSHLLLGNTS